MIDECKSGVGDALCILFGLRSQLGAEEAVAAECADL